MGDCEPGVSAAALRVAVLAPTLAPAGGLCRWSRETVRALEMATTPDRLTVDVLCRSSIDRGRATVEEFGLRCQLHDVTVATDRPRDALRSVRQVADLLARIQPDVVYTPLDWLWLLADRRRIRPKVVATAHGEPSVGSVNAWNRRLARRLTRNGSLRLTANAESLRRPLDETVGVPPGTSVVLPVATDPILNGGPGRQGSRLRTELGIHPDELVVLTLCRLVAGKRVDLVLDVIDRARDDDLAIRFIVAGDGPELHGLVKEAERRDQQGWVHFLGHIAEPGVLLTQADAVLHPSDSEGFPFSLVEALLAGTPVVATAVGGVPDVLADPDDGALAPKGDADALFDRLIRTLEAPPKRAERAARSERRFGFEACGKAHLALMREMADPGPR